MTNLFVSPFKNPFLNLAIEDYFLREGDQHPTVLLYVNRPSVVFGRFQNPWIECHLPYLIERDIWPVRRQSGGGCVYHDEGNLNFSFITEGATLDRRKFSEILKSAFSKAGISLEISSRNDLFLNGKKISGSAYKQTKQGSFHHGTFLVNSNLEALESSLKHTLIAQNSKSISSVRSKVTSLQEVYPHVEISDVIEIISHELKCVPIEIDGTLLSHPLLQKSFQQLISWEWLWGETPYFEINSKIKVRKGLLQESLSGRFSRETLSGLVTEEDLQSWFPDFSEQHKLSNLIF